MAATGLPGRRRAAVVAIVIIGAGLALAPVGFRMFERAPKGGTMLDEFRPYMDEETLGDFRGWMADIGEAETEIAADLPAALQGSELDPASLESVQRFQEQWPAIDAEMNDMLDDMEASLGNFRAVDALPPFPLFPWFFVLPGAIAVVLGVLALRRSRPRALLAALALLGVGLVAAPAVFQMFTRAPEGKEMIDTFRPLMTREKVTRIQRYFLVMGTAEGELRLQALPAARAAADDGANLPAVERWVAEWPTISHEMAPMIGAMADNLDNFEAVDALPPFSMFPWFFVVPGVLVAALAWGARAGIPAGGRAPRRPSASPPEPTPTATSTRSSP